MPLVDFTIAPVAPAVVGILIGVVHTRAIPIITPGLVIADAMRQGVVRVQIDATAGAALYGNEHPVVILRAAVIHNSQSSNFVFERRIQEAQHTAILRVCQRRAVGAWSDLEIGDLAIEEAVSVGVAHAGNVDGLIDGHRRLKVCNLTSDIAQRQERVAHNFSLNAQIPRLSIGRNEIGFAEYILAERNKWHILGDVKREGVPAGNTAPRILETSYRSK